MNNLQLFKNSEFGELNILIENGKELFPATETAKMLGYANPQLAIRTHCKGVREILTPTTGGNQMVRYIPEGDLFRLIVKSQLPAADRFELWIFDDVLPTIRKHGAYMTPEVIERTLTNPDFIIQLATQLKSEQAKVKELAPKAAFFDQVADSKDAISMQEASRVLNLPSMGRNKLFQLLRDKGVLMQNNLPYQQYCDRGYFRVIEQKYTDKQGEPHIDFKTLVYQKGLDFIRKILSEGVTA